MRREPEQGDLRRVDAAAAAEGLHPLRLSIERVWIYGILCAVVTSLPFIWLRWFRDVAYRGDFANFWSAGSNVGTSLLVNTPLLEAWQAAHGLSREPFVYPPAVAWLYAPLSHLAPIPGMIVAEVGMTVAFVGAGLIAARCYEFSPAFSIAAVLTWAPAVNSIEVGQNTGLALTLSFATILSLLNRKSIWAGLFVGLLLYKPTLAIPLLLLLVMRRQIAAVGVVAACAIFWYLLCVVATRGDWFWPGGYLHTLATYYGADLAGSAFKAYTLPTILMTLGTDGIIASCAGVLLLLACLPLLVRAGILEAGSMVTLVGLAASIHAWPYEAAMALPAIFYSMKVMAEPWRTRIVAATYAIVAVGLITRYGAWLLAIVCIGGSLLWLFLGYRRLFGTEARWRSTQA